MLDSDNQANGTLYCKDIPLDPSARMGTVLVSGATGYIGGRLVPELLARGHKVRIMVRNISSELHERFPNAEIVQAEAMEYHSLLIALEGIHTAYYLLHSLRLGQKKFEEVDLIVARNFRKAAEANNVKRIIYLSGLGNENTKLSAHLRNRNRVARVLEDGPIPLTLLRAGMIIGSGSASYEILRHLVKNSPVFFIPDWAKTMGQPIGVGDVIRYLTGVLENEKSSGLSFDIGGSDIKTYYEMLKELADLLGLKRYYFPSIINWTPFYGYIASLLTPVPAPITKVLIEGCKNEVVCQNNDIQKYVPGQPLSYQQALLKAMTAEEKDLVKTRWSDAYPPEHDLATKLHELNYTPRFTASYLRLSHKSPKNIFVSFCQVGGQEGWFQNNWMWRWRGALDRLMMGVGTARGRRSNSSLRVNDVIDFWRVENILENKQLLLRAEMKLPGQAWLEFFTDSGLGINRVAVTAFFEPKGWFGIAYWYAFLPFHGIIFKNLLKQIDRRA